MSAPHYEPESERVDMRREARIEMMAHAGRELAGRWGHPAWSESWSRLVAETLLEAQEKIDKVWP